MCVDSRYEFKDWSGSPEYVALRKSVEFAPCLGIVRHPGLEALQFVVVSSSASSATTVSDGLANIVKYSEVACRIVCVCLCASV